MTVQQDPNITRSPGPLTIPNFDEIREPRLVALIATGRAGTKVVQSFLDGHDNILLIPGYPLMYLYPHWGTWWEQSSGKLSWEDAIDLFCEKHASVLDSRQILGLSGLERLGPDGDQHIEIDQQEFRTCLRALLYGQPVSRRTFLLAVHYAYAICKGWDLSRKPVLFFHLHHAPYLEELSKDFPELKVVDMVRNPLASIGSTRRALGIVDQEKLNPTDCILCAGRLYRHACQLEFDVRDSLGAYINEDQTVLVKHESLNHNHEQVMKDLSNWLEVDYSASMLQSTFDGKLWWGDVTNRTPVNGLDPQALSERWRLSIGRIDAFVIEGVLLNLFVKCSYDRTTYKRDTLLHRLILMFAVLLPAKAEWQTIGFYLNPLTHLRYLRGAIGEATGRVSRKDYGWNGTYLYKWTYLDLKLWRPRWHQRFLGTAENLSETHRLKLAASIMLGAARIVYVGVQYIRLWRAVMTCPMEIFRRWRLCYGSLRRRVLGRNYSPRLLV